MLVCSKRTVSRSDRIRAASFFAERWSFQCQAAGRAAVTKKRVATCTFGRAVKRASKAGRPATAGGADDNTPFSTAVAVAADAEAAVCCNAAAATDAVVV